MPPWRQQEATLSSVLQLTNRGWRSVELEDGPSADHGLEGGGVQLTEGRVLAVGAPRASQRRVEAEPPQPRRGRGRASGAVYSLIQTTNQGVHGGECDPALRSEVNSLPRIRFLKKSRSRPRGSW